EQRLGPQLFAPALARLRPRVAVSAFAALTFDFLVFAGAASSSHFGVAFFSISAFAALAASRSARRFFISCIDSQSSLRQRFHGRPREGWCLQRGGRMHVCP